MQTKDEAMDQWLATCAREREEVNRGERCALCYSKFKNEGDAMDSPYTTARVHARCTRNLD